MTIENREKLAGLFDKYKNLLTQSQRQSLQLYLFEDLSLSEIGKALVITRQAAYDVVKKGEKKLLNIAQSIEEN